MNRYFSWQWLVVVASTWLASFTVGVGVFCLVLSGIDGLIPRNGRGNAVIGLLLVVSIIIVNRKFVPRLAQRWVAALASVGLILMGSLLALRAYIFQPDGRWVLLFFSQP